MLHPLVALAQVTQVPPVTPAHDYITTGGQVILAALGVGVAWITWRTELARKESKRATDAGHQAKRAAETAADLSTPTGNGFAGDVREILTRIERRQEEQAADMGGIRAEIRGERSERMLLARVLSNFIERQD